MEINYYDKVDPDEIIRKLDELIKILIQGRIKNEEKFRNSLKT